MLAIGAKEQQGISITTPNGTVITIVLKDITSSRATMLIDAPKDYRVIRISHLAEESGTREPQRPKR